MNKWKKVKIKDVCTKGTSSLSLKDLDGKDGDFPVYGAAGLAKKVNFYQQENKYLAIIKDGSGVGRLYRFDGKTSVLGTMQYIFPSDSIDYSFCYYALQSIDFKKYVNGAAIPHIYFKDYSQEEIPLPPMEEQKKIAARLDAVSDLLAKQKQLLSEQDNLIQSTFYDMFGDPLLNTNGYLLKYFDEIFSRIKNGANIKQSKLKNGLPITRIETISNYSVNRNRMGFAGINDIANYLEYELQDNDILISHINSLSHIGKSALYRKTPGEKIIHGMNLLCLRPIQSKVNPLYIKHLFKTSYFKKKILSITKPAVNQASFTVSDFKKLTFPLPPFELQQKFAAVAEQIESEKSKIKSAIAETQTLFNALMAEYFEE